MTDEEDPPPIGSTPPEDSGMVMIVAGAPPRCLAGKGWPDPTDPKVVALREAAGRMIARHPGRFPLRGRFSVGLTLRAAAEFELDDEGIDTWAVTAVEEVLRGAGVLDDSLNVVGWDHLEIDPALTDGYSIEIDHEPKRTSPTPSPRTRAGVRSRGDDV